MTDCDAIDAELLARIPSGSRMVLHVGCGAGELGEQYKRRNPMAKVIGIEADPDLAAIAKGRLDFVYFADIRRDPTPFRSDIAAAAIDCIVYGNALSETGAFGNIVDLHVAFLSDDAAILMALPNMEHWSIAERFLKGTAPNSDDQSACPRQNFPTESEIRAALSKAGLCVIDRIAHMSDPQAPEAFIDRVAPALVNAGIDVAKYRQRAAPSHHIWHAGRGPVATQLTVVSTMLSPVGGVSDVRVVEPMWALKAESSLRTTVVANGDAPPLDATVPKVFIFHRPLLAGKQGLDRIRALVKAGWIVVCEFDDHPDYIPVLQRPDIQNFRAVHAIQTTTDALASVFRRYNPEVMVFDNAIDTLPVVRNFSEENYVTLFFAGLNRDNDWPPYIEAINSVCARMGDRIRFEIINDRAFFDAVRAKHKNFTPVCEYRLYLDILSRCEISFMPLSDTEFNRCKSDLKYIEAAAHRTAALASDVVYSNVVENGKTGILFGTPAEFERRLMQLVGTPGHALSLGNAAREYVLKNRMLAYQLSGRASWYNSLWQRRDLLNNLLHERVPEL